MILLMVLRATPKDFGNISNLGYTLEAPLKMFYTACVFYTVRVYTIRVCHIRVWYIPYAYGYTV